MSEYLQQAEKFLKDTNTTLEVKESEKQTIPQWESEGLNANKHIQYTCTLKNAHHSYTFDFWGSIADYEKVQQYKERNSISSELRKEIAKVGKRADMQSMTNEQIKSALLSIVKPNAYDILASMYPMYEADFEDWCTSFGYDTDSMKAYKTYQACLEQDHNLRKLFDRAELEQLAEIQ